MPAEVARIGKQFMKDPIEITVEQRIQVPQQFHEFYLVNARDRYEALKRLADANPDIFSVILSYKRDTSCC
jgi:ATP-dependent RNA helicase DeaD